MLQASKLSIKNNKKIKNKNNGDKSVNTGDSKKELTNIDSALANASKLIESQNSKNPNFVSTGIFSLKNSDKTKEKSNGDFPNTKETNLDEIKKKSSNEVEGSSNEANTLDEKNVPLISKESNAVKSKKELSKSVSATKSKPSAVLNQASSSKEKKVTKTLAIVVIVFLVCW